MNATERDLTPLCQRLAMRYAAEGRAHPLVAAVAVAVRGRAGLGPDAFAAELGVALSMVEAAERGELPAEHLPSPYLDHADQRLIALLAERG